MKIPTITKEALKKARHHNEPVEQQVAAARENVKWFQDSQPVIAAHIDGLPAFFTPEMKFAYQTGVIIALRALEAMEEPN